MLSPPQDLRSWLRCPPKKEQSTGITRQLKVTSIHKQGPVTTPHGNAQMLRAALTLPMMNWSDGFNLFS